ncbi:LpxL/LpxP family acyltransferase [Teichococcus oryzae]|uniref:Lipid A biosynthesis acyltransferase n=1 Tax=Teichococcus oryzae TaxID=1608942 RepID=A0A5B2TEY0_9PROT|nr:lipid A biosynthesis acyltransferase [Pseudoroseomonas oryzae]KAA2213056.1 lipid A biosynthesis acyltransferase [Pseudoroseomonas oryzae]
MSWQRQRERGSLGALRLMGWVITRLGYRAAWLLLYPITGYFLLSSPRQRRAARLFLGRALGREAGWRDLFRLFFTFSATLLDRVFLLDGQRRGFRIEVQGMEALDARIAAGRGCILLGAHIGSFDALRAVADAGCPVEVVALMHGDHAAISRDFFAQHAASRHTTVIPLGQPDAMLRAKECLDRGGLVGILADRAPAMPGRTGGMRVVHVPFLGRPAAFPEGPHILAGVLGAPVMLAYGVWTGPRRYQVRFEPFAERIVLDRRRRQEAIAEAAAAYALRIEAVARAYPYNWFNFHDFWEEMDAS